MHNFQRLFLREFKIFDQGSNYTPYILGQGVLLWRHHIFLWSIITLSLGQLTRGIKKVVIKSRLLYPTDLFEHIKLSRTLWLSDILGCWWQNSGLCDFLKFDDRFDDRFGDPESMKQIKRSVRFKMSSLNSSRPYTLWFQNGRLILSYYLNNRIDYCT